MLSIVLLVAFAGFDTTFPTWPDGRTAALSLVFDDGRNDHVNFAAPMLTERGLVGTFGLMPGVNWATRGPLFAAVAAQGHELASHTMLHQACRIQTPEVDAATPPANSNFHSLEELAADCVAAKAALDAIQPRSTVSFVYPGGTNEAQTRAVIAEHFIAARLSTSGIQINAISPPDMMQVKPVYVGGAQPTVTDWCDFGEVDAFFDAVLTQLVSGGGWVAEEYHDIECPGYAALNLDAWAAHLDELQAMAPVLWVASMGDAARYIAQRNAAAVTTHAQHAGYAILSIDDGLDDAIFDLPMTVTTDLPESWVSATVSQGSASIPITVAGGFITYNVLANGVPFTLTSSEMGETFAVCMLGPGVPSGCDAFDFDDDTDVDLADFAALQRQ